MAVFGTGELSIADLTHNQHLWAITLDVLLQLHPRHALELRPVADLTAEFRAVETSVRDQLIHCEPFDFSAFIAHMRELTEID